MVVRARTADSPMSAPNAGGAQSERLIIVEQQRRHLGARVEAVSPVGAHRRLDPVAHLTQAMSRRTVRSLTSNREANTDPGQSRRACSSDSRVSDRDVMALHPTLLAV